VEQRGDKRGDEVKERTQKKRKPSQKRETHKTGRKGEKPWPLKPTDKRVARGYTAQEDVATRWRKRNQDVKREGRRKIEKLEGRRWPRQ